MIREAFHNDAVTLARIISESNKDVAVRFGLDAGNCAKHPSFCTEDWIKADLDGASATSSLKTEDDRSPAWPMRRRAGVWRI